MVGYTRTTYVSVLDPALQMLISAQGILTPSQAYDPIAEPFTVISPTACDPQVGQSCPEGCACVCHRPSSIIYPIPSWLNQWLGKLSIPRTLVSSLIPFSFPCNDAHCQGDRGRLRIIRYDLPLWFTQVEASIRFEASSLHFHVQTPRVVPCLRYLYFISFEEFRIKLSTREITVQDVEPDGYSVLHVSPILSLNSRNDETYVLSRSFSGESNIMGMPLSSSNTPWMVEHLMIGKPRTCKSAYMRLYQDI